MKEWGIYFEPQIVFFSSVKSVQLDITSPPFSSSSKHFFSFFSFFLMTVLL